MVAYTVSMRLILLGVLTLLANGFKDVSRNFLSDTSRRISIANNNNANARTYTYNPVVQKPVKASTPIEYVQNPSEQIQNIAQPALASSNSLLSVVYNSTDIASYFTRNPALVISRIMQILSETGTIFIAGMEGMIEENFVDNREIQLSNLRPGKVKLAAAVRDSMIRMGPTFIKLGQALSSRQDLIGLEGISQLQLLQDAIPSTFTTDEAREIIRADLMGQMSSNSASNAMVEELLSTLSMLPIAAASLGQVYKARVNGMDVAVKVQRPRLREQVAVDFLLARWGANFLAETGLLRSDGVGAVDEYASRLFEELDYINEANNLQKFAALYSENGTASETLPAPGILVPELLPSLCSDRVLTMTWLDGEKLIRKDATVSASDLPLVQLGIQCTLSQILETGVLHADPHGGNLLKGPGGKLAYLDFGLVATVPISVREALVCSVVHLIERNYSALAREFDSLMLMPADALQVDLKAFEAALAEVAERVLDFSPRHNEQLQSFARKKQDQTSFDFAIAVGRIVPAEILPEAFLVKLSKSVRGFIRNPILSLFISFLSFLEMSTRSSKDSKNGNNAVKTGLEQEQGQGQEVDEGEDEEEDVATPIPRVKFDEIISALFAVATRFSFTVPPYFLNNVRAIGSLEGMALTADPNFSLLEVVYPYVLRKVLSDFSSENEKPKKDTVVPDLHDVKEGSAYVNMHDDTDRRLGSATGQVVASGKTKEVFRSLILRQDKASGLHLPRWKRLRRFLRDASRASMDVNMNSPLASGGTDTAEALTVNTGATVSYVKKGDKVADGQIAAIVKQFLTSKGGQALLAEITSNIIRMWGAKIKRKFFAFGAKCQRQWRLVWGGSVGQVVESRQQS
jgi:predicted unusual protein kinase regulating ubiquinone biosynthesis (AarF/ABC1/UbiB family)